MEHNNIEIISKEFDLDCVYLFGNINSENDIDLLIISESFNDISIHKRKSIIKKFDDKIDSICLTRSEFEKLKESESSLWKKIIKEGKLIYGCDRGFA